MKRTYSYIIYLILSLGILIFISACEDDAILEPQVEDDCTGSYCSLSFPGSASRSTPENPKVF